MSTTGHDESSSEESSPPPNISTKPAVPPRPRNIPQDQRRITNINTLLNSKKLELAANMAELPCKDNDIENGDSKNLLDHSLKLFIYVIFFYSNLPVVFQHYKSINGNNKFRDAIASAIKSY